MKLAILLFALLFSHFSKAVPYSADLYQQVSQDFEVKKSWERAEVYVPSSFFKKSVDSLKDEKAHPVLVLAHGCLGITDHERSWARFVKDIGFIVVVLDSYAIPGRVMNCDVTGNVKSLNRIPVNALRPAELDYAVKQLQSQPWADRENIFVMGHSEGGSGAASMMNPDNLPIKGIIISGFNCSFGVKASLDTAILALEWESDPWFKEHFYYRTHAPRCRDRWGVGRPKVEQLIIAGTGHSTYENRQARVAVKDFLNRYHKK